MILKDLVVVVSCLPSSPQAVSRGAFWKDLFHFYQVGTEDRQRWHQESWAVDYMFSDIMLIVHSPWAAVLSRCLGNTLLGRRVVFLHSAHLLSHWLHPKLFPKALLQSQTSDWEWILQSCWFAGLYTIKQDSFLNSLSSTSFPSFLYPSPSLLFWKKIRQKQFIEALLQGDYKATVDKT